LHYNKEHTMNPAMSFVRISRRPVMTMQSVPGAVSDGSMVGVAVQRALVKEDVERV